MSGTPRLLLVAFYCSPAVLLAAVFVLMASQEGKEVGRGGVPRLGGNGPAELACRQLLMEANGAL